MIKLVLEAKNEAEKRILEYLENNVSETLAEKINNGVHIKKNDKLLVNKKTLSDFMKYASDEARKLAETGANCACVEDNVVYGWAIHYFEEETIEGKLFNEDGTEYKTEIKQITKPTKVEQPKKKENTQSNFFDLMNLSTNTQEEKKHEEPKIKLSEDEKRILRDVFDEEIDDEPIEYDVVDDSDNDIDDFTEEEIDKELDIVAEEVKQELNAKTDTIQPKTTSYNNEVVKMLYCLLDGNLEVK